MSRKEVERQHVALEAITGTTGGDEIARVVRPAPCQGYDVVEGGAAMIETRRAVHAPLSAVVQGGAPQGLLGGHVRRDQWPK